MSTLPQPPTNITASACKRLIKLEPFLFPYRPGWILKKEQHRDDGSADCENKPDDWLGTTAYN